MTKEQELWLIAQRIADDCGYEAGSISIHESGEWIPGYQEGWKVYCELGFCWELGREKFCEPEEVSKAAVQGLQPDGFVYSFSEPWDGFKAGGIDKAIEIMQECYSKAIA